MIYISCFLLSTAFAWLASRSKEKFIVFVWSVLSILVLCILGGLRYPYMTIDVRIYVQPTFNAMQNVSSFAAAVEESNAELGFLFVTYLSCKIFGHINWALFFYQLITISCFYIGAYRHRKNVSLPLLMFVFCFIEYNNSYMIMRQSMACGIIFMGLTNLEEKKYLKFSLYILVANLFHASALICFPLFIGVHMVMTSELVVKKNWLNFFIIFAAIAVLMYIRSIFLFALSYYESGVSEKYANYVLLARYQKDVTSWSNILLIIILLVMLALYRKKAKTIIMPKGGGGVNFLQFSLIVHIIYFIFVRLAESRVFLYSRYMYLIPLAAIPSLVREKHLKLMALLGVVSYAVLFWLNFYVLRGWLRVVYPYRSIL